MGKLGRRPQRQLQPRPVHEASQSPRQQGDAVTSLATAVPVKGWPGPVDTRGSGWGAPSIVSKKPLFAGLTSNAGGVGAGQCTGKVPEWGSRGQKWGWGGERVRWFAPECASM